VRWFLKRIFLRNSKNKKVVPEIKNKNEIHSNIVATMMQNRSSILKSGTKNIFLIELANSFSHELHKTIFLEQEKFRELKAGILIDKTETMGKNAHFPNIY
jgi:hypothetical protein